MQKMMETILRLIQKREFISVATCDFNSRPNAAPKFILKIDRDNIYLVDYTIGHTWKNLKINPRASLAFMDPYTLTGYQINGPVTLIERGPLYNKIRKEVLEKQIELTAKHIIEEVRGEGKHETFEVEIPKKVVIFKVKIDDFAVIGPRGELKRSKVKNG